jgi:hypothetical protein
LIFRASPVPEVSRSSISAISVLKSSNRRPKWANAASASPACQDPMIRSPAALISHTVPSASTRPNRCGSLAGGPAMGWGWGRDVGLGPGRGPGRGVGRGSLCGSSGVMSCRHLPFARLLSAHLPRIAAPSTAFAGEATGYSRLDLPSIEAACCAVRSELAVSPPKRQVFLRQLRDGRTAFPEWEADLMAMGAEV